MDMTLPQLRNVSADRLYWLFLNQCYPCGHNPSHAVEAKVLLGLTGFLGACMVNVVE